MSLIVHRCRCGHVDIHHSALTNACTNDRCGCRAMHAQGEPEVIPTFDISGAPVAKVTGGGRRWPQTDTGGAWSPYMTCDCEACQALLSSVA